MGPAITIGLIRRPRGLKGEVVVTDFTEGAFEPGPGREVLLLGPSCETTAVIESWQGRGREVWAKFAGIDDRDDAERYRNWRIAVPREALPETPADTYYEYELVGLSVETTEGDAAGRVVSMYAAGAHEVLVIEGDARTFEVPFVRAHVAEVVRGEKIVIVPFREV